MTEKQYRLNKWGTKLLKNNRPLFDWVNEADDIVDLLNALCDENEQLRQQIEQLHHWNKCLAEKRHQEVQYKYYDAKKNIKDIIKQKTFNCFDRDKR